MLMISLQKRRMRSSRKVRAGDARRKSAHKLNQTPWRRFCCSRRFQRDRGTCDWWWPFQLAVKAKSDEHVSPLSYLLPR